MPKISAVITSFNSEETIVKCIESVDFVDEIIVLDSFSTDSTVSLLNGLNCKIHQQVFKGFSQQKQDAIDLAKYDWILLLDSDEYLVDEAQEQIKLWMASEPQYHAYSLPRREWVFWQWSHSWVHRNQFVRLFFRPESKISNDIVHESVVCSGEVECLQAEIRHFGEKSIAVKIEKIHKYAQLAAKQKFNRGKRTNILRLAFYPLWYFFRQYFIRRQLFNGVAGFINAVINSYYAFLKYAKLYELQKKNNHKDIDS